MMNERIILARPFVHEGVAYPVLTICQYWDDRCALVLCAADASGVVTESAYKIVTVALNEFVPDDMFRVNSNDSFARAAIEHLDDLGLVRRVKHPPKLSGAVLAPLYELIS